jgi:hypothetical protein
MRPLLFIHTWQPDHDNGANDMCRGTFLYTWGSFLEHRFVFDQTRKYEDLLPDEIRMEVASGMANTSFKTKQAVAWAYERGYSHVCYSPTDCYFIIPRLRRNLAEHIAAPAWGGSGHDYWGFHTYDEWHIGGGSAYWLSRRAMEAVLAFDCYADYEDRWVGSACRAAGLEAIHDERYRSVEQPYLAGTITTHLSKATGDYDPEAMKNLHLRVIQGVTYVDGDTL